MLVGSGSEADEQQVVQENVPTQHLLTDAIERVTNITRNLDASKIPKKVEGQRDSAYTATLIEHYNAERRRVLYGLPVSSPSVDIQDTQSEQVLTGQLDASEEQPNASNPFENADREAMGDQVLEDLDRLGLQMANTDLLDEDEQDDRLRPVIDQLPIRDKKLTAAQKSWLKFGVAAATTFFGSAALNLDPWMVSTVSYLGGVGTMLVKSVHATLAAMHVEREMGGYRGHKLSKRIARVISHKALLSMVGRIDKVTSSSPVVGALTGAFAYGMLGQGIDLHNRIHHPQQVTAAEPHDTLFRPTTDQPAPNNNEPFQWKPDQFPHRQGPPAPPVDQGAQQPEIGQFFNIPTTVWGHEADFVQKGIDVGAFDPAFKNLDTNLLKNLGWGLSHGQDIGNLNPGEQVQLLNRVDAFHAVTQLEAAIKSGAPLEGMNRQLYDIAQGQYPTFDQVKQIAEYFPLH